MGTRKESPLKIHKEFQAPALVRPEVIAVWVLVNTISSCGGGVAFRVDSGLTMVGERIREGQKQGDKTIKTDDSMIKMTDWILAKWRRRERPGGVRDQGPGREADRPCWP